MARRRRKTGQPMIRWLGIFGVFNSATAKAYDQWATLQTELPEAFGSIYRVVLAKFAIPALKKYLKEEPLDKAIVDAVKYAAEKIEKDEYTKKFLREYLEARGLPADMVDEYIAKIKEALEYTKKVLPEIVKEVMPEYEKLLGKTAPAPAPAVAATA